MKVTMSSTQASLCVIVILLGFGAKADVAHDIEELNLLLKPIRSEESDPHWMYPSITHVQGCAAKYEEKYVHDRVGPQLRFYRTPFDFGVLREFGKEEWYFEYKPRTIGAEYTAHGLTRDFVPFDHQRYDMWESGGEWVDIGEYDGSLTINFYPAPKRVQAKIEKLFSRIIEKCKR